MGRAVFCYENYADTGVVTVSSSLSLTPPSRLTSQFPQMAKKCRNNGENSWAVVVDLLSSRSPNTFALLGLNLTAAAVSRVRGSSSDSSGQDASSFDSGSIAGLIDPKYGSLIYRNTSAAACRFVRFDVAQNGLDYIGAGRVLVGPSSQPTINFAPGWGRNRVDQSRHVESEQGVIYTDRKSKHRVWDLSFDFLSEADANGFVEEMNYLNGETDDVLLISDPDSTNLGRDSIYGQITGGQPIVQPYQTSEINSRRYTIRERT